MVQTRSQKSCSKAEYGTANTSHSPPSQIFQTLVSAVVQDAPQGLKSPLLKNVYYFLIHLSSHPWSRTEVGDDLHDLVFEIGPNRIRVTSKDLCKLSDILFKELLKNFKQLVFDLDDVSANVSIGRASSHPDLSVAAEELKLLLRCCIKMLDFLSFRQQLLLENGRVLHFILRTISLFLSIGGSEGNGISIAQLFSSEVIYGDGGFMTSTKEYVVSVLELSESYILILSAILEVFVDELSISGQLRGYFRIIDSVSSTREKLFTGHLGDDNIGIMMEVISTHFSLFNYKEQAFEIFLSRLSWVPKKKIVAPELSLTASLSLLHSSVMQSLPKLIQTHIVLLVSEAIGIGMDFENSKPDLMLINHYLLTFRRSVVLYTKHITHLQMDGCTANSKCFNLKSDVSGESSQPFDYYVQPVTREKISYLITSFNNSWDSHFGDRLLRTKGDLATLAIAYLKENLCILDTSCKDEFLSIISCIIMRTSDDIKNVMLHANRDICMEDVYVLSSLVKLMSITLLQVLWCLRHSGNKDRLTIVKNISCMEYDFIASVLSCFSKHDTQLPVQISFLNKIETQQTKLKGSMLMFFHFLRLLSLSFVHGFEFLTSGCILSIMAIMNLLVFEEGNLDALRSLINSVSQPTQVAVGGQISSLVVATKFQKIRTLYVSEASLANYEVTQDGQPGNYAFSYIPENMNAVTMIEETEETCNGEIFLRCNGEKSSEIDDLADFIECKQGKDYSAWLKDREKYRKWKYEKRAKLMLKKKKKAWRLVKGKKI